MIPVEKREHTSRSTTSEVEKVYWRLVEPDKMTDVAANSETGCYAAMAAMPVAMTNLVMLCGL